MEAAPTRPHRRQIPPLAFGILVVVVFASAIGLGAVSGLWQTSGRTTAGGEQVAPQGESAAEVKGWMAIGDVATAWDVPLPDLLAAFNLPPATASSALVKDLESGPVLGDGAPGLARVASGAGTVMGSSACFSIPGRGPRERHEGRPVSRPGGPAPGPWPRCP